MVTKLNKRGFTILEVLVAIAIFLIFSIGVYSGIQMVFKIVYQSRIHILETALINEHLEIVRNLPFESVGVINGAPAGVLPVTSTINRNGIDFNLVTTVRNIDDPFDGTINGSPADLSPADYKLVEISAICANCLQNTPVTLSTIVSPKGLEGTSQNGALFVHVFGAAGQPISGAAVQIQGGTTTISDTTANDGVLKVIDIPTGTLKYNVSVSKSGYSQDQTHWVSVSNPTPAKLPVTVISQTVSEIYLSIDVLGSLNLQTVNQTCAAIPNVGFSIRGSKIIGRDPDIYKYNHSFTTDGTGNKNFGSMEWDTYFIALAGTSYDILGTSPFNPLELAPGSNQQMYLVLTPHTTNNLLVKIKDAGTALPLSNATVRLSYNGYDQSVNTGFGFVRQTDWSGGSGQITYTDEKKYFADSGTINNSSPAGDLILKKSGGRYSDAGILESSTFDLGTNVNFGNIIWEPTNQPLQCGVNPIRFQIAASTSSAPASWNYLGPDGTSGTYYTATSTVIWDGLNNNRYIRYKAYLSTDDTRYTPVLSEVAFTFTNGCTPPGQAFFSGLSAATYNLEVSRPGYVTNAGTIEVSGRTETTVNLSPN